MTEQNNRFVRRTVVLSAAAAAVIFALLGAVISFYPQIAAGLARSAAADGDYAAAMSRLSGIDRTQHEDVWSEAALRVASAMSDNCDYAQAEELLAGLPVSDEVSGLLNSCRLGRAGQLMSDGKYDDAAEILQGILSYPGAQEAFSECQYRRAVQCIDSGSWFNGVLLLWSIRDYGDALTLAEDTLFENTGSRDVELAIGTQGDLSEEQLALMMRLDEARGSMQPGRIAVGFKHTVGLRSDGTVIACGSSEYGQCAVGGLKNVVQIAAGAYHTVALLSDGTVIACGSNEYGQCAVENWKNVVQIAAGDYDTLALLSDGTVVSCGYHSYSAVPGWKNVSRIFAGGYAAGCLSGGTMLTTHPSCTVADAYLTDAAVSAAYAVGLTPTGTVVTDAPIPDVWSDAAAVFASPTCAGIITADGEASVWYFRQNRFADIPSDRRAVSMALGGTHFAVLYEDGTVSCFGDDSCGQCATGQWELN